MSRFVAGTKLVTSRLGSMKARLLVLSCLVLMTAGCIFVPSPYSSKLNPVAEQYGAVRRGASRGDLEAQLGKSSREENGAVVWETRFDELNYTTLKVWFDPQDSAEKIEVVQAHGTSSPGYHASALSLRAR